MRLILSFIDKSNNNRFWLCGPSRLFSTSLRNCFLTNPHLLGVVFGIGYNDYPCGPCFECLHKTLLIIHLVIHQVMKILDYQFIYFGNWWARRTVLDKSSLNILSLPPVNTCSSFVKTCRFPVAFVSAPFKQNNASSYVKCIFGIEDGTSLFFSKFFSSKPLFTSIISLGSIRDHDNWQISSKQSLFDNNKQIRNTLKAGNAFQSEPKKFGSFLLWSLREMQVYYCGISLVFSAYTKWSRIGEVCNIMATIHEFIATATWWVSRGNSR